MKDRRQLSAANPSRKRVRLFDPSDLERLSSLHPLPLGWKKKRNGPKGLLFRFWAQRSPEYYYLSPEEAGAFLEISPETLRSWKARGYGPTPTQIGPRSFLYNVDTLLAWVTSHGRDG